MEERQVRIQKSQKEADSKMENAEGLITEYDEKIADIDSEKREILNSAREQAQTKKDELLTTYKEEAETKREVYLNEIEDEKEMFKNNLRKNLGKNAVKIASHVLQDISSKELEDEVFNTFIYNIENLHENISNPELLDDEKEIDLYSSSELSKDQKIKVEDVLKGKMKNLQKTNYEIDKDLILGYRLDLETYTIHTDIKNYLDTIEKDIIENIETNP